MPVLLIFAFHIITRNKILPLFSVASLGWINCLIITLPAFYSIANHLKAEENIKSDNKTEQLVLLIWLPIFQWHPQCVYLGMIYLFTKYFRFMDDQFYLFDYCIWFYFTIVNPYKLHNSLVWKQINNKDKLVYLINVCTHIYRIQKIITWHCKNHKKQMNVPKTCFWGSCCVYATFFC